MFEIVKDVPLPTKSASPAKASKYPFADMVVGDMFFIPGKTKNTFAAHASAVGKRMKMKFVTRIVTIGTETGIGCWRTE